MEIILLPWNNISEANKHKNIIADVKYIREKIIKIR